MNDSNTLCSEKNTHSRFLSYLHRKCSDFHRIIRECLEGNRYNVSVKVKYLLLLVASCWRLISVFVTEMCRLRMRQFADPDPQTMEYWWNETFK